ncbi:hypothetical protein DFH09DRAFT_1198234 [Mycena vulgaris]|nr:hypothetical protein DFH09DRAFT_1198234 [Mycena vulgaris]
MAAVGEPLEKLDGFHSVALSLDGKHIVSASQNTTLQMWDGHSIKNPNHLPSSDCSRSHLLNALYFKSPSIFIPWQITNNGWVSCCSSELLFWLPAHHRIGLWSPHNTLVIGRQQTQLSYENFVHGSEWAKCYAEAENNS